MKSSTTTTSTPSTSNPNPECVWLNTILSGILGALMALMALILFSTTGCADDGGVYSLVPGPAVVTCDESKVGQKCIDEELDLYGTYQCQAEGLVCTEVDESGGLNPDDDPPDNPSNCQLTPSFWDLRSYNGCMTSSSLSGAYRMANNQEFWFDGETFVEDGTQKTSKRYHRSRKSTDCGPMVVSAVSNSGTIQMTAGADVDWFLVEPAMAEVIWGKVHGGSSPSEEDIQSGEFASLLIDIYKCEEINPSCTLKTSIDWPTYGGIVTLQHRGLNAVSEGAFCGHMYVVAQSL